MHFGLKKSKRLISVSSGKVLKIEFYYYINNDFCKGHKFYKTNPTKNSLVQAAFVKYLKRIVPGTDLLLPKATIGADRLNC
jgi:hypothetical protein